MTITLQYSVLLAWALFWILINQRHPKTFYANSLIAFVCAVVGGAVILGLKIAFSL